MYNQLDSEQLIYDEIVVNEYCSIYHLRGISNDCGVNSLDSLNWVLNRLQAQGKIKQFTFDGMLYYCTPAYYDKYCAE